MTDWRPILCFEGRREEVVAMHGLGMVCWPHLADLWAEEQRRADAGGPVE